MIDIARQISAIGRQVATADSAEGDTVSVTLQRQYGRAGRRLGRTDRSRTGPAVVPAAERRPPRRRPVPARGQCER